ncbi:MAG TPA: hypothetical protein VMG10_09405 [Gemmataceae bacterium]|nr:hypothetical protein [Gemmataceae bacterium]
MAHDHSHGDRSAYYLNQLFTIAVCGALGGVAVMLWWSGKIALMLHPKFYLWVLLGGITLLVLVVLRAMAVWQSVDEPITVPDHTHDHEHCGHDHGHCDHDHGHDPGIQTAAQTTGYSTAAASPAPSMPVHHHHDHDHDHEHHHHGHDHGHDHDHEHGWAPWRYVVLLLPVVLYFLNLPNQGFSADAGGNLNLADFKAPDALRSTGTATVGFTELQQASLTPESRDYYEGKTITLTGQYLGNDPKRFTLRRFKIACCAADAIPLNAVIMVDPQSSEKVDPDTYRNQWVEVKGRVHFFQKPGSNEYVTALILYPTSSEPLSHFIKKIPPPATPWVN